MRFQATGSVGSGRIPSPLIGVRTLVLKTRNIVRERIDARKELSSRMAGPSIAERQDELSQFYGWYEEFVELICDSAQYGPSARMEEQYDSLRSLVAPLYAQLRPLLGAYLPPNEADAFRFEQARPLDAFEQLFHAPDLRTFLNNDDGEMIFRINCTRGALNLYAEHLRQLAARAA